MAVFSILLSASCAAPFALGPAYTGRAVSYEADPVHGALGARVALADQTGYLSYHATTFADLGPQTRLRRVTTRSCISGLTLREANFTKAGDSSVVGRELSVIWGTGGVQATLQQALETLGEGEILSDIAFDVNQISILGVWRQNCLVLDASVSRAKRLADVAAPAVRDGSRES